MILERLEKIRRVMAAACAKAGCQPKDITLVAVTKYTTQEHLIDAVRAGITDIGENRVQDAKAKFAGLAEQGIEFRRHMIGHLQTNKVKEAVALFDMIQSVDSLKVAQEIDKQAAKINKDMEVLIQVNAAREGQKSGADPHDVLDLLPRIASLEHIRILGLMAIGPLTDDAQAIRRCFSEVKQLFDQVQQRFKKDPRIVMKYLSMGMTHDYEIAIAQGANMVRIGSALFG